MAWLQSDSKLRNHFKLEASAEDLGITKVQFIGHLHLLWWWVIEYKEKGVISPYGLIDETDKESHIAKLLARGAEWEGDVKEFFEVLVQYKWIDVLDNGDVQIHDWNELSGKYSIKKEQGRERARRFRERKKAKEQDEFYNPKQMDMEAEVWDGKTEIVETISETNTSSEATKHQRLFASLTRTIRGNWDDMPKNERGRYNDAVGQLAEINADPEQIPIRFKHYVLKYGSTPTPQALVNNWGDLARQPIQLSKDELGKLNKSAREGASLDDWANE